MIGVEYIVWSGWLVKVRVEYSIYKVVQAHKPPLSPGFCIVSMMPAIYLSNRALVSKH